MDDALIRVERDKDDYESPYRIRLEAWRLLGTEEERADPENGVADLVLEAEGSEPDDEPTATQLRHIDWLVANQQALLDAVLETALRVYKGNRLDDFAPDQDDDNLPILRTPAEVMPLLTLSVIHVSSLDDVDLPYVGIDLWCDWDQEHGLGLMYHGLKLVDVGGTQHLEMDDARHLHDNPHPDGHLPDPNGYGRYI